MYFILKQKILYEPCRVRRMNSMWKFDPPPHPSYLTLVFWSCNHFIHQKYIMNTNTFWNTSAFFFGGGGVLSNYTITIKENCVENLPSIPSIPAFSYCIRFAVFCVSFSFNINLMIFLYTLMIHVHVQC